MHLDLDVVEVLFSVPSANIVHRFWFEDLGFRVYPKP